MVFRRSRFFHGAPTPGTDVKDITWLRPDGGEKEQADWEVPYARCLGFVLSGEAGAYHLTTGGEGEPDDTFLVIMNAYHDAVPYCLPSFDSTLGWELVLDTAREDGFSDGEQYPPGHTVSVSEHSMILFIRRVSVSPSPES